MNLPPIFSDRQFKWVVTATAAIALMLAALNLLSKSDSFIYTLNSGINFFLAVINAIAAASIWRWMSEKNRSRLL